MVPHALDSVENSSSFVLAFMKVRMVVARGFSSDYTTITHGSSYPFISRTRLDLPGRYVLITGAAFDKGVEYATADGELGCQYRKEGCGESNPFQSGKLTVAYDVLTPGLDDLPSKVVHSASANQVSDRVLCFQGPVELHSQSSSRLERAIALCLR